MALKRMIRAMVLASLAAGALAGCTSLPDISQARSPCRYEPGGWCGFMRVGAAQAFPYAIAATNAYRGDDDVFVDTGEGLRPIDRLDIAPEDAKTGFSYELFERLAKLGDSGEPAADGKRRVTERIIAFRGTDFDGLSDIYYGTLRRRQIELALAYFERERARFSDGAPWVAAGHSLGGALATEVSIHYPDTRAFLFNTSPFFDGPPSANDARRVAFNERGEFLRQLRRYRSAPAADLFTLNCAPGRSSFRKHKIRALADCITWIAAYESAEAARLVAANRIRKPPVECGAPDKPHPGPHPAIDQPCVHRARPERAAEGARGP